MSEDRTAGGQDLPRKERQGLPEATPRGNRMRPKPRPFEKDGKPAKSDGKTTGPFGPAQPRIDCLFLAHAYLEAMTVHFPFENTYAALPAGFFARVAPTPVASPRLIKLNRPLAIHLGLDPDRLSSPEGTEILAGKRVPDGADPIAMAYAGHQFGHFVPQLGDGRAILLGEVIDSDGIRRDVQLKGSGPTPFSRRGDGRAALGPVLREYIVSEAMATLGIPTTRALAVVVTGESVMRETPLPGAVLTRVASSHIRVGTFQYFAARGDTEGVRRLADHVLGRHYPHLADADRPYHALLDAVIARQAELVARWLLVGFIHGVMNTDNTSISGETIDYGPCAFMDHYDPAMVFSSIDELGRYAYANQPRIALWNLTRLAECLLPLLADEQDKAIEEAQSALGNFVETFDAPYQAGLRRKLGLFTARDDDRALAQDLLDAMAKNQADFTLTFRRLSDAAHAPADDRQVRELFADPTAYDEWAGRWRQRIGDEPQDAAARQTAMRSVNPAFIPRNHRIEAVIDAAVNRDDFAPFEELLTVLSKPYEDQPALSGYAEAPEPHQRVLQTFCGT
jgi:serine/tyrosine/threonine adenylyltransferase